jgi:hypothetical protein
MRGISRGATLLAVVALLGSSAAVTGIGVMAAHAAPDVVRYAAADGQGAACTKSLPCSLVIAVTDAPLNSEVRVAPGTYGSPQQPLTTTLATTADSVQIIATSLTTPPTIYEAGSASGTSTDGVDLGFNSRLQGVTLVYSGPSVAVHADDNDEIVRDAVTSTADGTVACQSVDYIIDTLCYAPGANSKAVDISAPATGSSSLDIPTLLNVTAVADGSGGVAVNLLAGAQTEVEADLISVIAEGTADTLALFALESTSTIELDIDHSDLGLTTTSTGLGQVTVTRTASDTYAAPKFVDPGAGNFQERPTSPTVDAGKPRGHLALNANFDPLGNPRTIGTSADIGAYELLEKPRVSTPAVVSLRTRAARMGCHLWAQDRSTTFQLVAVHGKQTVRSAVVKIPASNNPKTVDVTIFGLAPHMHYLVHAVAQNSVGTVTSKPRSITTKG